MTILETFVITLMMIRINAGLFSDTTQILMMTTNFIPVQIFR